MAKKNKQLILNFGFMIVIVFLLFYLILTTSSKEYYFYDKIILEENVTLVAEANVNYIQAAHTDLNLKNLSQYRYQRVNGESMRPTIFAGNYVLAEPFHKDIILEEGMIITYKKDDNYVTHRIRAIYPNQDRILTQGDNARTYETIEKEDIIFIVKGVLFI